MQLADRSFFSLILGGGEQIFVKCFPGLVYVYKNTPTGLKCLIANFICYATQLVGVGGGSCF